MSKSRSKVEEKEGSVEAKLRAIHELQQIDSKIDKIRTIRGELPLEVIDLEDSVKGLETRLQKYQDEITSLETLISDRKNIAKDAAALIKKYEGQQGKVRNNREYDSITKELEFQNLEIQLSEKKTKEAKANISSKKEVIDGLQEELKDRQGQLKRKREELEDIVGETQKEEESLIKKSKSTENHTDERLLSAYKRIRSNVRNGLGVVPVLRDACGGCFNKIPPQRQLDIRMHKKIIVCEHCGRILVDASFVEEAVKA